MATVDSAPGSTAIGGGGGGTGGGGKKPNNNPPPSGHYVAAGGDTSSALWMYETRPAKSYILEWRSYSFSSLFQSLN
jgi:hypothetical protein